MPLETRTRITLLLPAPKTYPQYLLVDQVRTDLTRLCGGVTHSTDLPAVVSGRWLDAQTQTTQRDDLLLLFGDSHVPFHSPNLAYFLDRLKVRAQRDFAQEIIWVTIHEVYRVATDDRVT